VPLAALRRQQIHAERMAETIKNAPWIEWMQGLMGGTSRHTLTATLPPHRYHCLLDELPLHLIPKRARKLLRVAPTQERPLFLNPDCIVCSADRVPEELESRRQLLSGFALEGTIAWVRNPTSGNLIPFWLGPQLESVVLSLRPGDQASSSVGYDALALLCAAGILTTADHTARARGEWSERVARSSPLFRVKGYAPIPDLIHPFHVAALRRYYRYLIRTGAIALGDGQSSRRYVAYNEPVTRFFHEHVQASLSAIVGEPVKPSYVYLASYLSGAELKRHTDREQCEFSVTFCLDFSPEPALETPWPIQLDTPNEVITAYQSLGDGLAYRGTRLPHYRTVLGEGQTSSSIFFHYVSADFRGSLD
jgi:hypothetical protein